MFWSAGFTFRLQSPFLHRGRSGKVIQLFKLGYAQNSLWKLTITLAVSQGLRRGDSKCESWVTILTGTYKLICVTLFPAVPRCSHTGTWCLSSSRRQTVHGPFTLLKHAIAGLIIMRKTHMLRFSQTYVVHPKCHIISLSDRTCSVRLCNESLIHQHYNTSKAVQGGNILFFFFLFFFLHAHPGQGQESSSCVAKALNLW